MNVAQDYLMLEKSAGFKSNRSHVSKRPGLYFIGRRVRREGTWSEIHPGKFPLHCDLILQNGCALGLCISLNDAKSLIGTQDMASSSNHQASSTLPPQYLSTLFMSSQLHCHCCVPSTSMSHLVPWKPSWLFSQNWLDHSSNPFSITRSSFSFLFFFNGITYLQWTAWILTI